MAAETLIREFAPAKVNLYLHVTGKRDDGYHLLDSLVMFADVGDYIDISSADDLSLVHAGPFGDVLPDPSNNLIMRAATALQDMCGFTKGAHITLNKNLPVASGIGGGSADAAAAIRGLCGLWNIDVASEAIMDLALSLGADVPVCLRGQSTIMRGIGENFTDLNPCPSVHAILVNPGVGVSTPSVFKARIGEFSAPFNWNELDHPSFIERLHQTQNDLESAAISLSPVIAQVLDVLSNMEQVKLVRMSGSGATCFALFDDAHSAQTAAISLQKDYPDWWSTSTIFGH